MGVAGPFILEGAPFAVWRATMTAPGRLPPNEELCAWMRAIAEQKDRQAFAALFGVFAPRVKTFLMRYGAEDTLAEDLAQETMLTVWRRAEKFDAAKAAVSTWVFTIARNKRIDRARRDRGGAPALDASDETDDGASGEDVVLAAERESRVRAALANLPPEQARIVELSFFAEKPHSVIARELDLPLGTVKSRVRLALARLRGLLEGAL